MTKNEMLATLQDLGNEKRKQMYIKNGASENTYGVLLGELRKLAKQLGRDHELALELWKTGNTDAQWLSCMMLDAKKMTLDEVRSMTSSLTYADMIDKFINEVVCNHDDAKLLSEEWSASNNDYLGRAGWDLIVKRIAEGKYANAELEKLLLTIEAELQNVTPNTQWAMNYALCKIGINYPAFTNRCIDLGETLGVYKDLKVPKGCTSAYAPIWISTVVKKSK